MSQRLLGSIFVFVYGTLKRDQPNHYLMLNANNGKAKFVANGTTQDSFPMVIGTRYNIPFLVHVPNVGQHIHGEIYEVDDNMLATLDELEGHPNYYLRQLINIHKDDG